MVVVNNENSIPIDTTQLWKAIERLSMAKKQTLQKLKSVSQPDERRRLLQIAAEATQSRAAIYEQALELEQMEQEVFSEGIDR